VGLDDAGIGIDLEEGIEVAHVDGIFEEPGPGRIRRADQLQQIPMSPVGGQHVGLLVPGRIAGQVVVHLEAIVGELLDHQLTALLGKVGAHEMDGLEGGVGFVHRLDLGIRELESGMIVPLGARRSRLGTAAQPVFEGLQVGILSHQVMQRGAARADQAADHQGTLDAGLEDFGLGAQSLLGLQPADQDAQDHLPRHGAAVLVEARLFVVAAEQDAQTFEVALVAEVVAARDLRRLGVKPLLGVGEARRWCARHGRAR